MVQLFPYKHQWEAIAQGLQYKDYEIEGIKGNLMVMIRGPEGCLGEVIYQWIGWTPGDARGSQDSPTLEALKRAVKSAGHPDVASKLSLSEK